MSKKRTISTEDPFILAIDQAGRALLERASGNASVGEGEEREKITLSEQVKAFEAVARWAETRAKIRPVEPEAPREPKKNGAGNDGFSGLQRRWNDAPGGGGGIGAEAPDDIDTDA